MGFRKLNLVANKEGFDKPSPQLVKTLAGADALTPYGVEFRYPGDLPSVSRTDGEKAVRLAEQNARSHYRLTAIIYQCREAGW